MKTNELIDRLATDASVYPPKRPLPWPTVAAGAFLVGAVLMFLTFPVRPDLMSVADTYGFLLKPIVAALIAASALKLIMEAADPTGRPARYLAWLGVGLLVLAIGVGIEMMVIPPARWTSRLMGDNPAACAASVFGLSLPLLAIVIAAIRQRATVRPILAGALSGLFSGAIATFLYAAHCPDNSPFFLAVWYGLAIAALIGVGAIGGRLFLRW